MEGLQNYAGAGADRLLESKPKSRNGAGFLNPIKPYRNQALLRTVNTKNETFPESSGLDDVVQKLDGQSSA